MVYTNQTNIYANSRYIVGATNSPYTTIQSAINAANTAGGNATIWVRSGTYTENLTLYDTIDIEGADSTLSVIVGTHVPPNSGTVTIVRCGLNSGTHIFSSAAAGTTKIVCNRCRFNLTNGYVFNLANWTGELDIRYSTDASTANGLINNAGGSPATINHSIVGIGTGNVCTVNGNVKIFGCDVFCPFLFNGTGTSSIQGGSIIHANVATADTHTLTIGISGISSGAASAITHNSASTLVLNNVVLNSANASAIAGTGTIQTMSVSFPTSNVIAGTITSLLTGVTRTAEMWSDNITRMTDTGFYSWAAGGPYFDDTTLGTFQLLVGGTGYIRGKRITWVAQNYTGMTAGNTYFIYIDSAGTIGAATTHADANYQNYIILFECMRDSTPVTNNQVTVAENHPYDFQVGPSNFLHDTVGPIIENANNGANITLNGTQGIQINGADALYDHGLNTTIPDSGGVAETWIKMYTTAAGKWARQNATNTFTGYYNNAGTPTVLTANRFAVYRLYVSKASLNTTTPTYFAVLHTAQFITIGAANTAIGNGTIVGATNELALLEMAQLGYIIYSEASASIVQVTISKSTLRSTITSAGTNSAALVNTNVTNFDGILSAADTNVQSALETIDEFGKNLTDHCVVVGNGNGLPLGVIGAGSTGDLLTGVTGADPAFATSSNGNFTFTSATAAATRTLTVINTDNSAANSGAALQVSVGGTTSTGDPYTNYLVTGGGTYSIGIDNSDSDLLKITTGASPSAGSTLMTIAGSGTVYTNLGDFYVQRAFAGGIVESLVSNTDNTNAASSAGFFALVGGTSAGDPYTNYLVTGGGTYSVGIDNSDSDKFKITASTTPSGGTDLFTMTSAGVITLANDLDVSEGGTGVSTLTSHGILMGNGAGDINATAEPSNGQLLIGKAGDFPQLATITAGSGISVTNAAGAITIASSTINQVIQIVYSTKSTYQNCTTALPADNTIPQKTEGDEVITVTITPTSATNILVIEFTTWGLQTGAMLVGCALFQDATNSALAAVGLNNSNAGVANGLLRHIMISGTTSATTFKIRVGPSAATGFGINSAGGGITTYGGVDMTTMTVTEYKV